MSGLSRRNLYMLQHKAACMLQHSSMQILAMQPMQVKISMAGRASRHMAQSSCSAVHQCPLRVVHLSQLHLHAGCDLVLMEGHLFGSMVPCSSRRCNKLNGNPELLCSIQSSQWQLHNTGRYAAQMCVLICRHIGQN